MYGCVHAVLQNLLVPVRHAGDPCSIAGQGLAPQVFAGQQGAHAGFWRCALGGTQGQATEIEIHAREILKTREQLNKILAENTGQPVTDIDEADRVMLCHIGRMTLVSDRGDVPEYWRELDKRAREHFKLEALGDLKLNSVPDPDGFVFPDYERARDPFRNCLLARMH